MVEIQMQYVTLAKENGRFMGGAALLGFGIKLQKAYSLFFHQRKTDVPMIHEKLIQQADTALYQARTNGRNCVELFDEEMSG